MESLTAAFSLLSKGGVPRALSPWSPPGDPSRCPRSTHQRPGGPNWARGGCLAL